MQFQRISKFMISQHVVNHMEKIKICGNNILNQEISSCSYIPKNKYEISINF